MHIQEAVERGTSALRILVPERIGSRWGKHVRNEKRTVFRYMVNAALKRANVSADDFSKCWAFVAPALSDQELFNLLKRAGFGQAGFGQPDKNIDDKANFIKQIMRRFQVMGGPVRLSHMPLMYAPLWLYAHPDFVVVVLSS